MIVWYENTWKIKLPQMQTKSLNFVLSKNIDMV